MSSNRSHLSGEEVQELLIAGEDVEGAFITSDITIHMGPGLGEVVKCTIQSSADPILEYHVAGWSGLTYRGNNWLQRVVKEGLVEANQDTSPLPLRLL